MRIRVPDYGSGFHVFSLALDECTRDDLISEEVECIYIQPDCAKIYPEGEVLTLDSESIFRLGKCNNYDVFGIFDDGTLYRYYDDSSTENVFFIE